jgi:hypothetical protein
MFSYILESEAVTLFDDRTSTITVYVKEMEIENWRLSKVCPYIEGELELLGLDIMYELTDSITVDECFVMKYERKKYTLNEMMKGRSVKIACVLKQRA